MYAYCLKITKIMLISRDLFKYQSIIFRRYFPNDVFAEGLGYGHAFLAAQYVSGMEELSSIVQFS